jgi:hypothetical protein
MLQISDLQASMDSMGGGGSFNRAISAFNVFGEARESGDLQEWRNLVLMELIGLHVCSEA